ncbi:unnamed protein product [Linum tenue]|uniref:DUF547 domain-containing protein n=1 Tax=Linum tenue TaxID=586396 RepID=A0AAV0L6E4_9ROSI|nr:unnamed protein product [Linum tenue]
MARLQPRKVECRLAEEEATSSSGCSNEVLEAKKISEDMVKCLSTIFMRMRTSKDKAAADMVTTLESECGWDAYYHGESSRDNNTVGPYSDMCAIEASSIDLNRATTVLFLLHGLKFLMEKLGSVNLEGLTHQQKLSFLINICNSCMMNVSPSHSHLRILIINTWRISFFVLYFELFCSALCRPFWSMGCPRPPEMLVALMQKINYLHQFSLILIMFNKVDLISKMTCEKASKNNSDEMKARNSFGLEWSEPLVTFALSCGSWSSPAVQVYTATGVEEELEAAKRDYLVAAAGMSKTSRKLMIPKLLGWYLLDYAKDMGSLLDWVCLQLHDGLRDEAVRCVGRKGREPLSHLVQSGHALRFQLQVSCLLQR